MDVSDEAVPDSAREPARRPEGRPYRRVAHTRSVSMLGLGMVAGVAIGAGLALLMAPRSGRDMRAGLRRKARRIRRGSNVWDRLGEELKRAAAAKRREIEREAELKQMEIHRRESASV